MRIILDIANQNNVNQALINVTDALSEYTVSAVCIDETNDNQFHNDPKKNTLTDAQIQSYSDYCESEYFLSAAVNSGGNSCFI